MLTSPLHFVGRITAILLLLGCIVVVFTNYNILSNDRSTTNNVAKAALALQPATFDAPTQTQHMIETSLTRSALNNVVNAAKVSTRMTDATAPESAVSPNAHPVAHTLHPTRVVASTQVPASQAGAKSPTYFASNVSDGDFATSWRVLGDGSGQSVTLMFGAPIKLQELQLMPGRATMRVATDTNLSMEEGRVSQVRLEFTNAAVNVTLADTPELQSIPLNGIVTNFVRVVILETLSPSNNYDHGFTSISEIVPLGEACVQGGCGALADTVKNISAIQGAWSGDAVIEKADDEYARVAVLPPGDTVSSDIVLLKHQGSVWTVAASGTAFTPQTLHKLGIPPSIME